MQRLLRAAWACRDFFAIVALLPSLLLLVGMWVGALLEHRQLVEFLWR